jgi:hypothetical protein
MRCLHLFLPFAFVACAVKSPNWPIKTGGDPQARDVRLEPVATTIDALRAAPKPDRVDDHRIVPVEMTMYLLRNVTLRAYQRAIDHDIHLEIADEHGHTMIAEIPDPDLVDDASPWRELIAAARAVFEDRFPSGVFGSGEKATVSLAGVGFFDFAHLQPGVAPNAIELHPVLGICFDTDCTLAGIMPAANR